LEQSLSSLTAKLNDLEREKGCFHNLHISAYSSRYRDIVSKISDVEQNISWTKRDIESEQEPPPPLLQPLPANEAQAMRIIFFLEMPRHFQVLLRLSFMAQQLLLPRQQAVTIKGAGEQDEEIDIQKLIAVEGFKLDWKSYYTSHCGIRSPVPLQATLASSHFDSSAKKKQLGPSNVMSYTSDNDGVWHPDTSFPGSGLWWSGGTLGPDIRNVGLIEKWFDPWRSIPTKITANYWVETLPANRQNMQWAMTLDGNDRGNLALANQNTRPSWLSKPQFLSFASVRAFANLQDRKVCVALHERSLPLEQVSYYLYWQHRGSSDYNFLLSHWNLEIRICLVMGWAMPGCRSQANRTSSLSARAAV